jgi:DNA-directed RNA polymerase subunit RPC12/RpoP
MPPPARISLVKGRLWTITEGPSIKGLRRLTIQSHNCGMGYEPSPEEQAALLLELENRQQPPPLPEVSGDDLARAGRREIEILFRCRECGEFSTADMLQFSGRWCPECGSNQGFVRAPEFDERVEAARRYSCPVCGVDLFETGHQCNLAQVPEDEIPF